MLPTPPSDGLVIAWTDVTQVTPGMAAEAVRTLPDVEQARFARFRHVRSAHEFLAGRLLVRHWLAALTGTSMQTWQFVEGARGRPEIAAPVTTLRFNLAHSGGVVACVMADGRDAGVDVEDLDRRMVEPELWHRYCAPSEIADIEAQPEALRRERFLTYWTLKEAYLKARGLGIAVTLADVAFAIDGPDPTITFLDSLAGTSAAWAFGMTTVAPHHLVSWATPHQAGDPRPRVDVAAVPIDQLVTSC